MLDVQVTQGETQDVQIFELEESGYIWLGHAERHTCVFGMADVLTNKYLKDEVKLQLKQNVAEALQVKQFVSQGVQVLVVTSANFPDGQVLKQFLSELSK